MKQLHDAIAKASAALQSGLTGLVHELKRDVLPDYANASIKATFERERFWFVVGLCTFFVALTVTLLVATRDKGEESAGEPVEDEERGSLTPASASQGASTNAVPPPTVARPTPPASAEWPAGSAPLSSRTDTSSVSSPGSRFQAAVNRVKSMTALRVKQEEGTSIYTIDSEELIRDSGISGLCVVDPNATCGVTGVPVWTVVVTSALQCWILQFFVLYWLYVQIKPRELKHGAYQELPRSIVFVATYTHFVSCVADFPFHFYLLFWIRRRKEAYRWVFVTVFLMDAFMIPMLTLVIGSLYLINSKDVHETILNCCAVAFIANIDNWILAVSGKMEIIVNRTDYHKKVKVPINRKVIQVLNWWVCLIPVIPTAFTCMMLGLAHVAGL